MDDALIVDLYLARDESAIAMTQEKYGEQLRRLSYSIVADRCDAEECVSDTYIKAWNSIPPNKPSDYLYVYLARITRQCSLDCARRKRRRKRNAHIVEFSEELAECNGP